MPSMERIRERGNRRAQRSMAMLAEESHDKRVAIGISQQRVAQATGLSRQTISRIETVQANLSLVDANLLAAALGLELSVRLYPGPEPLRDAAHARRLGTVLAHVAAPLAYAIEVPLPQNAERPFEQRAWDALITGSGERTGVEMEMRLRDAQALERRVALKRRDDPVDNLLVLIADTHANRQIMRDNVSLFPGMARLTRRELAKVLGAGVHPPSALALV